MVQGAVSRLVVSSPTPILWKCTYHGELAVGPLLLRNLRAEVLPLLEVRALCVLDLAGADDGHGVLEAGLLEGSNWGCRKAVKVPGSIVNLLEALKLLEEAAKVDLAIILARADWSHSLCLLALDDVGDGLVLSSLELRGRDVLACGLCLGVLEISRSQERADMLGVEGKSTGHD